MNGLRSSAQPPAGWSAVCGVRTHGAPAIDPHARWGQAEPLVDSHATRSASTLRVARAFSMTRVLRHALYEPPVARRFSHGRLACNARSRASGAAEPSRQRAAAIALASAVQPSIISSIDISRTSRW